MTTDASGSFTVKLCNGESITIQGVTADTTYTASEVLSAQTDKGFTMDAQNSVLTGQIVKDQSAQAHIINIYAPSEPVASITVSGIKTVSDEAGTFDWTGKSFSFKLEQYHPETGAYTQIGETATVTQQGGSYTFTDVIKLNAIGTYYYKVSEVIPEEAQRLEGMSYDATAGRFVVEVTDNDVNGELEFQIRDYTTGQAIDGTNGVFTFTKNFLNTHSTDATYVEFTVDKTVTDPHNAGISEAGFLFGLYKVEGGVVASEPSYTMRTVLVSGTDGKATFHIPVTQVGQTQYILKEIVPEDSQKIPGMIYDAAAYTVLVSATAQEGKLVSAVSFQKDGAAIPEAELVFNNVMNLDTTSVQWGVNKVMTGIAPATAETFTFTLTETDGSFIIAKAGGVSQSITITGAGTNQFSAIEYAAVGTHYYVVRENAGARGGMTYDAAEYHITVDVTVDGTKLQAATAMVKLGAGAAEQITFTNAYSITGSEQVSIGGTKYLRGRNLMADEFEFGLYEGDVLVSSVKNLGSGKFTFPAITYTAADIGTHTYTVREIANGLGGVSYDRAVYTVVVTVSDNGEGGLRIEKTVDGAADGVISFTNTYQAQPAYATISGTKTLTGRDLKDGEFTFEITDGNGYSEQATNDADGIVAFSSITFDAPGQYIYTVTEVQGSLGGITYDTRAHRIVVDITDNGDGTLSADVSYPDGYPTFVNTYSVSGDTAFSISGTKRITGRSMTSQDVFTFVMKDENGNVVAETQNEGGQIRFENVKLSKLGVHTFTVAEQIPDGGKKDGITYSTRVYTVTVNVTDNGQGGMAAGTPAIAYQGQDVLSVDFTNSYSAEGTSLELTAKKSYEKALQGGDFTFLLTGNGQNQEKTNDAQGNVTFDSIPLNRVGTYSFTITEKKGGESWVDYDETVYSITAEVKDDEKGKLYVAAVTCTADGAAATDVLFDNDYILKAGSVIISGKKELYYRDQLQTLKAEQFAFGLYENGKLLQTVKNDAEGNFSFFVEYQAAGEHTYTVQEIIPDNREVGMIYDQTVYTLNVSVTDDNKGNLLVEKELANASEIIFRNATYDILLKDVFRAEEPSVSIDGKAVKVGEVLEYTIAYTNTNATAVDVIITDKIPAHTEFVSSAEGAYADGVITWERKNVAVGQTIRVTFRVKVVNPGTVIENEAQIFDGNNRTSNKVTNSIPGKTVDKQVASVGEILTYTITYTNTTGELADLVITDKLDSKLGYIEGTAGTGVYADGVLTWTLDDVAAGQTVTVSFQAKLMVEAADAMTNIAQLVENNVNVIPTNETVTQVKFPTLKIEKTQSAGGEFTKAKLDVKAGTVVTYKLTVSNTGEGSAYGLTVSDKLPAGLLYVENSADNGGKLEADTVLWTIPELEAGKSIELTFQIMVPTVDKNTSWVNVATVVSENDPPEEPSNEVEISVEIPVTPETGDHFNMVFFLVMMAISACGMVTVTALLYKEKKTA